MNLGMTVAYESQQDMLFGILAVVDQLIIHSVVFEPYLRDKMNPGVREV